MPLIIKVYNLNRGILCTYNKGIPLIIKVYNVYKGIPLLIKLNLIYINCYLFTDFKILPF